MTKYESEIKTLHTSSKEVFELLSNLSNIEKIAELPIEEKKEFENYVENVKFDNDSISISLSMLGNVGLRIIEREPYKTIKFETENSSLLANAWIQLVEKSNTDTKMKLTIKAEIPTMIKMMIDGKLKEGINKIAETLANVINKANEK